MTTQFPSPQKDHPIRNKRLFASSNRSSEHLFASAPQTSASDLSNASHLDNTLFARQKASATHWQHKRSELEIKNAEYNHERIDYETRRAASAQMRNEYRSEILKKKDMLVGYNLISLKAIGEGPKVRPEGITNSSTPPLLKLYKIGLRSNYELTSNETRKQGMIILKNSSDKFFAPQYSGHSHEYRQAVLLKEGLLCKKTSGIISVGKAEAGKSISKIYHE